ncbi:hypothetical protein [Lacipirellula limnantheis]|uniref:hypothetical protein n=1 Tax=Lacipirellula limnantheis TaxID=2528024 RepID=UPI0011A1A716|nr:hypothetical protein [Lacipirellula limnantheis]
MRPPGSATVLEARRHRAAESFQAGKSLRTAADHFGVNLEQRQALETRLSRRRRRDAPHPCGVSKLSVEQRDGLVGLVVAGPLAAGFKTDL